LEPTTEKRLSPRRR